MIKVKASDIKTGSILDEELRWSAGRERQRMFEKSFMNRDEAMAYCISMVEGHPDVAFWIYEGNFEPERVVNQRSKGKLVDESKATPWGFWATIGLSCVVVATVFIIQYVIAFVFGAFAAMKNPGSDIVEYSVRLPSNGFFVAMTIIFSAPICTALTVFFTRLSNNAPIINYLGLQKPTARQLVTWVSFLGTWLIYSVATLYVLNLPIDPFMYRILATMYSPTALYLAYFFLAPIWEELFFRGFLFQALICSRLGPIGAIGLTSLVWALMHLNYGAWSVIKIFFLGVLLGFARYKTESTYLTMVMHSLNNFVAITAFILILSTHMRWIVEFSVTVLLGMIAVGIGYRVFAKQLLLEGRIKNH